MNNVDKTVFIYYYSQHTIQTTLFLACFCVGCSLKQLDLDSCTLSEILRLHILASGADCSSTSAKFRYQKQGGFSSTDDPCVELRLSNQCLVKKLSNTAVYDLLPGKLPLSLFINEKFQISVGIDYFF